MQCPKCGETVESLRNYSPSTTIYTVTLGDDGRLEYYHNDVIGGDEGGDYECPNCGTELAHNDEDALAFMKGEGISDEMAKYYAELAMEGKDK